MNVDDVDVSLDAPEGSGERERGRAGRTPSADIDREPMNRDAVDDFFPRQRRVNRSRYTAEMHAIAERACNAAALHAAAADFRKVGTSDQEDPGPAAVRACRPAVIS